MSFEHNSVRKNLFLSACFCWDSRLFLHEMDQKFKFGGLIGYGKSYLNSVFRYSKVFTLHAILHDAAGAVRSHSGKRPGYCYMIHFIHQRLLNLINRLQGTQKIYMEFRGVGESWNMRSSLLSFTT